MFDLWTLFTEKVGVPTSVFLSSRDLKISQNREVNFCKELIVLVSFGETRYFQGSLSLPI